MSGAFLERQQSIRPQLPEFTSVREKIAKMLFNSCIRKMERSRKSYAASTQEEWRHAVSKFRRAVSMKIAVEKR